MWYIKINNPVQIFQFQYLVYADILSSHHTHFMTSKCLLIAIQSVDRGQLIAAISVLMLTLNKSHYISCYLEDKI